MKGPDETESDFYQEPSCLIQKLAFEEALKLSATLEEGYTLPIARLMNEDRLFLLEVACSPNSLLTQEALEKGLTAERASLFNGYDLTSPEGLQKLLNLIREKKPRNIWLSTECGPFSPIQNFNQRTEQQQADLKDKQRKARKQHLGGLVAAYFGRSQGCQVHWEWSRRCRAWKWEPVDHMRTNLNTYTSIVGGCRVGLHDEKGTGVIGKEWRVESTSESFSKGLHLPCLGDGCQGHHVRCEGSSTRRSAFYTKQMVRRIVHYMKKDMLKETSDLLDPNKEPQDKGVQLGRYKNGCCNCHMFKEKGLLQLCPECIIHEQAFVEGEQVEESPDEPMPQAGELSREDRLDWQKKFRLIHGATGHGSLENLIQALKHKQVSEPVLDLAKRFVCEVCEERKKPNPRRVANLEVIPKRWRVALADCAFWRHPRTKQRVTIGLLMDQGSRFLVGKVLSSGETANVKSGDYIRFYQENWQQYFGHPEFLRFDAEGTWMSRELDAHFSKNQVMLDPIPGDAHWHLSPLERSTAWLKELLSRLAQSDAQIAPHEALAQALATWNQREMVRGFSPYEHALGQAPDLDGRFFREEVKGLPIEIMETPIGELENSCRLRMLAEETFIRWQAKERLNRALNSKSKTIPTYLPGELVFWALLWLRGARKSAGPGDTF